MRFISIKFCFSCINVCDYLRITFRLKTLFNRVFHFVVTARTVLDKVLDAAVQKES